MSARPTVATTPMAGADGRTLLALIRHMGRTLDDLEKLRIQHQLRRMAFEREHETPLPPDAVFEQLTEAEHEAELELIRLWRQHELAAWAKSIKGIGEKSIARLIAEVGDPATRNTASQLWAYCGYDPNRKRRKGMTQDEALACGNPRAKKQCWLIATALLKAGVRSTEDGDRYAITPAGERYLAVKAAKLAKGWTPGHAHNHALRILAKVFLKDLWIASRHLPTDTHSHGARGA